MTKIIKKLNKNNIKFTQHNNSITFSINDNGLLNSYTITQINNNKFSLSNNYDKYYLSYKSLIKSLNKYQLTKNW